jgi:NAD(P)-dependent dehydrogenase (short-subunit alcohol dehydrogenase family)
MIMGVALITGGHAGLGYEAATRLAERKQNLVLAGRDLRTVEKAAADLRTRFGIQVATVQLDLSSLASVRAAAAAVQRLIAEGRIEPLDALICNAGTQFVGPISYSEDGYEETFAINHLGHFLLLNLLLDSLTGNARVVCTASGTHDPETMDGKLVGKAIEPDAFALANEGKQGRKPSSGGVRYATSKLCNVLFAYELNRRLAKRDGTIVSIAFDPGFTPETGLSRTAPAFARRLLRTKFIKWLFQRLGVTMGSLTFSGEALARLAVDPQYASATGQYFQSEDGSLVAARSSKVSYDEERALKLWTDSETLVKLQPHEMPEVLR